MSLGQLKRLLIKEYRLNKVMTRGPGVRFFNMGKFSACGAKTARRFRKQKSYARQLDKVMAKIRKWHGQNPQFFSMGESQP